ncbi:unnamed protein product [Rotaria sp. Silwood2]|nr:unnamed protein product [Rotaria sp. Silwood2]
MNPINLQENFKIFWNKQHPHKSSTSTSSNSSSDNCLCEACIGIGPSELWSLQNAVAFELNEYLPKILTNQGFNMGLDPNLRHMDSKEKHYRQKLSTYALNDCLSMQRIIIEMKNKKFEFNSHLIKYDPYDLSELSPISSTDDDIFLLTQLSSNQVNKQDIKSSIHNDSSNLQIEPCTLSSELLENNFILPSTQEDLIIIHSPKQSTPSFTYTHTKSHDWKLLLSNDDNTITINSSRQQSSSTHRISTDSTPTHEALTVEQKRRIHNRSCTLRQRNRYYRHELTFLNIDRRFTIRQIKSILRQYDVSFYAVNISTSTTTSQKT